MNVLLWLHIAGGSVALFAGAAAAAGRKGGALHARAGLWFVGAMLLLGVTATILAQAEGDTALGLGGIFTCYFVLTGWVTARRRDGATGRFEWAAGAAALAAAGLMAWSALNGAATPVGPGPIFVLAGLCLLAGLGDFAAAMRGKLTPVQRLTRHLWRMCVAFFIATGSFFLGQQDALPAAMRGSPLLLAAGFAPLALLPFWLVRIRFRRVLSRLKLRARPGRGDDALRPVAAEEEQPC
jgi:hypothetical protein